MGKGKKEGKNERDVQCSNFITDYADGSVRNEAEAETGRQTEMAKKRVRITHEKE